MSQTKVESYEIEKWTSHWPLCNHVRVYLEVLIERFGQCRCGRWPYCKCIDPWTDKESDALINALNGVEYSHYDILSCLRIPDLTEAERTLLKEVARHAVFCLRGAI